MFILYFYGEYHQYHHASIYRGWADYANFRPGESLWLVPGTDPEDDAYGREYPEAEEDTNDSDETLEYMCDLLEASEILPSEFRRQMRNEGYDEETIRIAVLNHASEIARVLGW